jgi:hypothetical protein
MLPKELIDIIKDYTFHTIKKIPKDDERYELLLTIPYKQYVPLDDITFVYMRISGDKDYFMFYNNFEIQLQILVYGDDRIHCLEEHSFIIE